MGIQIGECKRGSHRTNINSDDADALLIQMQKARAATSRRAAVGALSNPTFVDQLLGNRRDGAALKSRLARQVGTRNRLTGTNQIEHDAPINIARRFAGGNLEVC
jgi:hypothetical protein